MLVWRCVFSSHHLAKHWWSSPVWLRQASSSFLALVFPDDCRVCGEPLTEAGAVPVCAGCLRAPKPLEAEFFCSVCRTPFVHDSPLDEEGVCRLCRSGARAFDAAYAYGGYDGVLRKLIHLFKYAGMRPLARPFGNWLARALPGDERLDAIVPMPLHWRRRLKRGFNQSDLLARELARHTGLPVMRALRRHRHTPQLAQMTAGERRREVSGAFQVKEAPAVRDRRLLLLDDVLTTGATVNAAAAALKKAGASRVAVLTLARVDRRPLAELGG
jgi:ComF family protein